MLTSVDARRRWFGSFFLILAVGFLIWGLTLLKAFLIERPLLFITYWLACFLLTGVSFAIAVYDLMIMRRRIRGEQKAAFDRAFKEVSDSDQR